MLSCDNVSSDIGTWLVWLTSDGDARLVEFPSHQLRCSVLVLCRQEELTLLSSQLIRIDQVDQRGCSMGG